MSEYERTKLQQFVDIMAAGDRPAAWLLEEAADIIGRLLGAMENEEGIYERKI